ncbi:MAG: 2-phospho-L-lactate guanylyltransferase [Jatrophihabitantaceae bacterium]
MRWTVLIPTKSLPEAKTRLTGASADSAAHHRLVRAIRADTLAAARAADGVARLVIVTDRSDDHGAELTFVQTAPGLNAALAEAAADAANRWPRDGLVALLGDLPALRPDELAHALADAARTPRSFVPDAAGTGTTLLAVHPGVLLAPAFGPGSAARHAAGAVRLDAGPGLRHDVDTADDLETARVFGLGAFTRRVLEAADSSPTVHLGPA